MSQANGTPVNGVDYFNGPGGVLPKFNGSTRGPVDPYDFPKERPGGTVLVTGATGLVGSHVVHRLCLAGYHVRGTSRSKERAQAWSAKWPKANVEWFIIPEQTTAGCYDEASEGCVGIFHVAGPYNFKLEFSHQMIDSTYKGILNVLEAAKKQSTVRRVVHVNSLAAIHQHDPPHTNGVGLTYDDTVWNTHTYEKAVGENLLDRQYAYTFSKKNGELLQNKWIEHHKPHFDVVTLCPSTNYGRILYPCKSTQDLDTSSTRLYNYILHALEKVPENPYPNYTAVKDTARAALNAFLYPGASGKRYQLTSGDYSYSHIFSILKKRFPEQAHRFPDVPNDGLPFAPRQVVDTSLVERDLGMRWSPLEEVICEEVADFFAIEKAEGKKF